MGYKGTIVSMAGNIRTKQLTSFKSTKGRHFSAALLAQFGGRIMKKIIFILFIAMFSITSAGCASDNSSEASSAEDKSAHSEDQSFSMKTIPELREEAASLQDNYVNLDLSETSVFIPDVDEIYDISFPLEYSLEEQKEKFEENIRKYAGLDADEDLSPYLKMSYWDTKENERIQVFYSEASEEQLSDIQYLSYNDGKYSEVLVFSNYMLEMGYYEIPTMLTGDTADYSDNMYGYRGLDLGTPVETYQIPEDDISDVSYVLEDGGTALADAVAYAEQHVEEDYYFVGSDLLDYHVYRVQVRQLTDSVCYYQMYLYPEYRGIPFNYNMGVVSDAEESLLREIFGAYHVVSMFRSNQLGYIWSSCHSYETVEQQEKHSEFISLKDACSLLSDFISDKSELKIDSLGLIYQTEFVYDSLEEKEAGHVGAVYCHPVYHFYVDHVGMGGYSSYYFDVDAVTGEVVAVQG